MVANSSESSERAPRTRRRVKADVEGGESPEMSAPVVRDDAADVIFDEGDNGAEKPRPAPRRRKVASRRRTAADEGSVETPIAPPAPEPESRFVEPSPASYSAPAPAPVAAQESLAEPGPAQYGGEFEAVRERRPRRPRNDDRNYRGSERTERFEQNDFVMGSTDQDDVREARDFQVRDGGDGAVGGGQEPAGDVGGFDDGPDGPDGAGEMEDGFDADGQPRRRRRRRRRGRRIDGLPGAPGGFNNQPGNFQGGNNQQGGGFPPNNQGYNQQGYNQPGNNQGYNQQGYNQQGANQQGANQGYNQQGYNQQNAGGFPGNQGGYNQQGGFPGNNYPNNGGPGIGGRPSRRGGRRPAQQGQQPPMQQQPPRERGGGRGRREPRDQQAPRTRNVAPNEQYVEGVIEGVLEMHPKGYGFLRDPKKNYMAQESDPFVPSSFIEKNQLREGVLLRADVGPGVRNQGPRLRDVLSVDGLTLEAYQAHKPFDEQTPVTPYRPIRLETGTRPVTMRVMDLVTPIGKGQRALIVAPPRTGKTMLLQDIADSISTNHPEIHLMVLLVDERPEEVTEMVRRVKGEVIASSMDREVESHVRTSQLIVERGKRMAECGRDVFILMDSITRMARAFNKWTGGAGGFDSRTMSGGLSVKALDIPKKLFGSARQFDGGGSLTIVATALIETGGRMDEVIFQEFKGTGNMELVLSRDLADRRIWPAIDITRSGTRHEEKLFAPDILDSVTMMRRSLISLSPVEAMETLTRTLDKFPSNREFLQKVKAIL